MAENIKKITIGSESRNIEAAALGSEDKGNTTTPIYLEKGVAKACTQYAGGTCVMLNGQPYIGQEISIYAPTEGGTANDIVAWSNGVPTWVSTDNIKVGKATADADGNNIKSTYLTSCGAVSTYLSKTDAENTYLSKAEAAGTFLTTSGANNTYLSKTDASSTYLTKSNAEGLYLTVSGAVNTYLTKTGAAGTYLTTSGASSTYLTKTGASDTYLTKTDAADTYLHQTAASNIYLTTSMASSTYLSKTSASSTYLSKTDAESTYIKKGTGSAITKTSGFVEITYEDGFIISNDYSHVLITVVYSQVDDERLTAELDIDWGGNGNFRTLSAGSMLPGATFEILSGGGSYYLICKDYQGKTVWSSESDDLYLEFDPSESFRVIIMTEVF